MASIGQSVRKNWSVLFALGVAAYLGLTTVGGRALVPDISWAKGATTDAAAVVAPASPTTTSASSVAGALSFKVNAIRIRQTDAGSFEARVTLDVTNNGSSTARFQPNQVTISRNGGAAVGPIGDHLSSMDVSPHISQLAPLTFEVNATPGAKYRLLYGGTVLFDGYPI